MKYLILLLSLNCFAGPKLGDDMPKPVGPLTPVTVKVKVEVAGKLRADDSFKVAVDKAQHFEKTDKSGEKVVYDVNVTRTLKKDYLEVTLSVKGTDKNNSEYTIMHETTTMAKLRRTVPLVSKLDSQPVKVSLNVSR